MISVNTNVAALMNGENQRLSGRTLADAMEHVSTGRQVNRGADDPSGLGISTMRNAQIRGMGVAIENIQSAIGFLESGFSGMEQIGKLMQRMRELAVRAGNEATMNGGDFARLDAEFQSLSAEIDRTAKTTGGGSEAVAGQTPIYWPANGKLDLIYVMDTTGSMGGVY